MKRLVYLCIFLFALYFSGCALFEGDENPGDISPVNSWLARAGDVLDDEEGSLNPYVLHVIRGYPLDGSYPYRWEKNEYDIYNGVTEDLVYRERILARAHPNGTRCSNCCGLTFEIFFRSMRLRNLQKGMDPDDFNSMNFDDLFNMMLIWFVVGKGDSPREAITYYGLGEAVDDWEEARSGDFMDISRNNGTGHSVIFISWLRDEKDRIAGLRYFSSNSKGVGFLEERFSDTGGKVLREYVHIGRVGSMENYRAFDRKAVPNRNP